MNIFVQVLFALSICSLKSVWSMIHVHPWNEKLTLSGSNCTTNECYDQAAFISRIIDQTMNPCDDFYEYVCANWKMEHPDRSYYPEWSIDTEMGERSFYNIRSILEEPIMLNDTVDIRMAKIFFKECSALPYLGIYDSVLIASHIQGSGYFPLFNPLDSSFKKRPWLEVHNYYLGLTGESALFDVTLRNDKSRKYEPTFHISELASPYGLFIPNELISVMKLKIYKEFLLMMLKRVIAQSKYWKSYSLVEKDLMDVLAFRRELDSIIREHFIMDKRHKIITIRQLDHWYSEMVKLYKSTARISWMEVFRILYRKHYSWDKMKQIVVDVENKMYLQLLARLISETPENVIVNHIHIYFIERHLDLGSYLKGKMMDVITEDGKLIAIVRYIGKRWQICIAINQAIDWVGIRYVRKFFLPETKKKAENLVKELKSMMKVMISDSTWLDTNTKHRSQQLVDDMQATIGYPDFYDDWSKKIEFVNRNIIEPGKIDAIYSPQPNRISISAGYLNLPMFSIQLPPAVIYGATGMNIGHQMYRAFGSDLIERHEVEYIWPSNMLRLYKKKMECFVKKYDGVPVTELEYIHPVPRINGSSTLDENMADVMGLQLAYQAFRKKLWLIKNCESLTNLPDINCYKLFFISFAMSYCSALTPDAMMELTEFGVQSTPRVRVNTAVANIKEFGKIFKCSDKARLKPHKRCNLWM